MFGRLYVKSRLGLVAFGNLLDFVPITFWFEPEATGVLPRRRRETQKRPVRCLKWLITAESDPSQSAADSGGQVHSQVQTGCRGVQVCSAGVHL